MLSVSYIIHPHALSMLSFSTLYLRMLSHANALMVRHETTLLEIIARDHLDLEYSYGLSFMVLRTSTLCPFLYLFVLLSCPHLLIFSLFHLKYFGFYYSLVLVFWILLYPLR